MVFPVFASQAAVTFRCDEDQNTVLLQLRAQRNF
jgi:hypothetical protein